MSAHRTASRPNAGLLRFLAFFSAAAFAVLCIPGAAAADPCVVPDDGSGTVTLPPAGCEYLSPDDVHMIIDGLPAGTTIELAPIHKDFICFEQSGLCTLPVPPGECEVPGVRCIWADAYDRPFEYWEKHAEKLFGSMEKGDEAFIERGEIRTLKSTVLLRELSFK